MSTKMVNIAASLLLGLLVVTSGEILQLQPNYYESTAPRLSSYYSQDGLGQYSYGYSGGPSTKTETKTLDGVIRGTYSYLDDNGNLQRVDYIADDIGGYRAAASAFPTVASREAALRIKQVEDTPEVALAKLEHLQAHRRAQYKYATNNGWKVVGPSYSYSVRVNQANN